MRKSKTSCVTHSTKFRNICQGQCVTHSFLFLPRKIWKAPSYQSSPIHLSYPRSRPLRHISSRSRCNDRCSTRTLPRNKCRRWVYPSSARLWYFLYAGWGQSSMMFRVINWWQRFIVIFNYHLPLSDSAHSQRTQPSCFSTMETFPYQYRTMSNYPDRALTWIENWFHHQFHNNNLPYSFSLALAKHVNDILTGP